jgi:hypothetical protein
VTQNLDLIDLTLDQTELTQLDLADLALRIEALERRHVDDDRLLGERHAEAALRQPALHRRLSTLKVQLAEVAGLPGLLALETATRHLANAGAGAAAQSALFAARAFGRRQPGENIAHDLPFLAGAALAEALAAVAFAGAAFAGAAFAAALPGAALGAAPSPAATSSTTTRWRTLRIMPRIARSLETTT